MSHVIFVIFVEQLTDNHLSCGIVAVFYDAFPLSPARGLQMRKKNQS